MNNLNSVIIEGNLTADPEIKFTPNGSQVGNFRIASNRHWKDGDGERQEDVSFVDVEVWSRLAETCAQYLKKGRSVRVVGAIKQNRWTTPEGEHRSRFLIAGQHVEFGPKPHVEDPQVDEQIEADVPVI